MKTRQNITPKPKQLFPLEQIAKLSVETSKSNSRKYPNVMWFPRSKTDPQEIREVLKSALSVQQSNEDNYFNDKLLGEYMAKIGSINVVGMQGEEYIEAYKGKSTGDVSYITNAHMLMRVFRFLGFVRRIEKAKYQVTELGVAYCQFSGDFPAQVNGENEEQMLLQSLANFAFYSVNDDSSYRDNSFRIRPFISLLNSLAIEPQCIYQLIVTAFAAKSETADEIKRIEKILENLRSGETTLEKEFEELGLDANDYSCVHNFYDSAKILVYIGTSLGLIDKQSDPSYGKKIAGKARHLKQASTFYFLTEKGQEYLKERINERLIYYSDLYDRFGDKFVLQTSFMLAALNTQIGSRRVKALNADFFEQLFGDDWHTFYAQLTSALGVEIDDSDNWLTLQTPLSFNFFQSIPPEFLTVEPFSVWYSAFIQEFEKTDSPVINMITSQIADEFSGEVVSRFILDKDISYVIPDLDVEEAHQYMKYLDKENIFGGQDRFSSRVSPTNSVFLVGDKVHVNNDLDALDLLVPLRRPDENLRLFIRNNLAALINNFLVKSDQWMKDQHYVWVRNCFRQFGSEAIYSGSGGMLSRADISVVNPIIGGVEAKSPSENRGSINTKAIRQAVDAKVQVGHKFPEKKDLPRAAIAVGRRITPLAIQEELKWRAEGQPVLLISDPIFYYLTLRTVELHFDVTDIIGIFVGNAGLLGIPEIKHAFDVIMERDGIDQETKQVILNELGLISEFVTGPQ